MKGIFYEFILLAARFLGIWVVALFAWIVSSGFFLFSPRMVANNVNSYRAVFPGRNVVALLVMVLRQFHHFATVFVDRVRFETDAGLACETVGLDHFEKYRKQGQGGIFLMSHFGNWEVAARLFGQRSIPLMLHLGKKQHEQIEKRQKLDLAHDGIRIVSASDSRGAPFELLESVHALRQGGVVSIAGDRVQSRHQRTIETDLFGHKVRVPVAPHLLALVSGAPVFTLFTVRVSRGQYQVIVGEPYHVKNRGSRNRDEAIGKSIRKYMEQLEKMVRKHPEHWYQFEPFLYRKAAD